MALPIQTVLPPLPFKDKFRQLLDGIITPSFSKCIQSLQQYGIIAKLVNGLDQRQPNISLDIQYSDQSLCSFLLSPIAGEEKVGMRIRICRQNQWNYDDATRVDVDQVTESLIRLKVQEALDVLEEE